MPGSRARTAVSALLAGIFLLSLGGEAYGWHDCPHHHGTDSRASTTPDGPRPASAGHAAPGRADGRPAPPSSGPRAPAEGPCTCVGSCHAAAASPLPASSRLSPVVRDELRRVSLRTRGRSPRIRRSAYFLPFPNGPPVS